VIGRREFITLLGGATAWPLPARAQQIGTPVIGFLNSGTREGLAPHLPVFLQALNEIGFVEGRNVTELHPEHAPKRSEPFGSQVCRIEVCPISVCPSASKLANAACPCWVIV
jgi:putative ABC transport system substrate-binding protein